MHEKHIFNVVHGREGQNGKTFWQRCGIMIHDPEKERYSIRLDTIPVGEFNGWLSCFPKEHDDTRQGRGGNAATQDDFDDIPFD